MYKVLLINGSPRTNGCTFTALNEMNTVFKKEGFETEIIQIGNKDIRGCISCNQCKKLNKCVIDNDIVNSIADKFKEADGIVVGSPVYYASPNGTLISFLDRLMYSTQFSKQMKVGAAIVSARRSGSSSSLDVLNKYFTNQNMPLASSTNWNIVHGFTPEDVYKDDEGLQTMRNLAHNMVFMIKAIKDAKEKYGLPEVETGAFTSFPDGK